VIKASTIRKRLLSFSQCDISIENGHIVTEIYYTKLNITVKSIKDFSILNYKY
jgi:hypothetical protein